MSDERLAPVSLPGQVEPVRLHYQRMGWPGPSPVVLLHGLGLSTFTWRKIVPALAEHREVVALDLLGFGRSDKPQPADYSVTGQAEVVLRFLEALDLAAVTLVGHSLGGAVALALAVQRPERVARLILIGSAAYPQKEPFFVRWPRLPFAPLVARCAPRLFCAWGLRYAVHDPRRIDRAALQTYAAVLGARAGAEAYSATVRALRAEPLDPLCRRFSEIRCPTLILHGENDRVVPRSVPERLAAELPQAHLHFLPWTGHLPQEEQPQAVLEHLWRFLDGAR